MTGQTPTDRHHVGNISFDPERLTRQSRRQEGAAQLSASPYDVPDRMTVWKRQGKLRLCWHYIDTEPTRTHSGDSFQMEVGQNSGRLYELSFQPEDAPERDLKDWLQEALGELPPATARSHKKTLLRGLDNNPADLQQKLGAHMNIPQHPQRR